jgi:hypothetical protein
MPRVPEQSARHRQDNDQETVRKCEGGNSLHARTVFGERICEVQTIYQAPGGELDGQKQFARGGDSLLEYSMVLRKRRD